MKKDVALFLGLMLGIIIFAGYFLSADPAPEVAFGPVEVGGSITIKDQNQLDFVEFEVEIVKPGFITIHRTISTAPAEVIGTTGLLDIGNHNLKITLTGEMLPGFKYVALLHVDNGDRIFEADKDFPVMTNGEVVRPYFLAIPEAERLTSPDAE